jgi:hypothetical protein
MSGNHAHAREAAISKALETFMRGEADRCLAEAIQPQEAARMSLAYRLTEHLELGRPAAYPPSSGFVQRSFAAAAPAIGSIISDAFRTLNRRRR